jgi:hypothetical protein
MASYIRVLQDAVSKNLSLSEYLTLKIMGGEPTTPTLEPTQDRTEQQNQLGQPVVAAEKKKKSLARPKREAKPKAIEASGASKVKPVASQPANAPTEAPMTASERRKSLKKELGTLNRRISGYERSGNEAKLRELVPQQEEVFRQLQALKGKRK